MIYRFNPILKTLVWGTENWVLSGVKGNETRVAGGPDDGKTLNEVYGGEFPLLIKFIDARQDLSIQVHPNDEIARERHGCKGKTEMWYMIDATPGARLLSGFSKEISEDDYVRLVEEGRITDVLASHEVAPGDVFFLPAGRVHAICGGCYLAEIQETSDITYRIFDYKRPGLDGKPRQLHTQEAKDVIDYKVYPSYRTDYEHSENAEMPLVRCPYFTTSAFELTQPLRTDLSGILRPECGESAGSGAKFYIVMGIGGQGAVVTPDGTRTSINAGEALLVMDEEHLIFEPQGPMLKLLTAHI